MAIQQLGPPPLPQDPDMLFAALPDPARLPVGEIILPASVDKRRVRARIGRGGMQPVLLCACHDMFQINLLASSVTATGRLRSSAWSVIG